jgi:hypothetical protein
LYSRRVIDLVISDFAGKKDSQGNKVNFEPKYHSIAEVDEFSEYIAKITKDDGNSQNSYFIWRNGPPSDQRLKWIRRWIANEKFLIFADAEYFITRYAKIRAVDEQIVRMEFRIGQRIFFKILAEFDDLQVAIQVFCLKCRQVGISTCVVMFFLHRILTRSQTHAVMASASIPQSEKLNIMIKTALEKLPFWIKPGKTSTREKEPRWENGSAMSIQAGSQTVAIAEGSAPSCIHLSEIADYDNPVKTIEQGLFPAAHQTSSLFFAMEGTGDIASPWQKEKWEFYKKNWRKPGGRFRTIFIPPCCAPDIYPHADWLRANPVPEGWHMRRHEETKRMEHRAALFVRSTDYLCDYFGASWEVPLEYQWYWENGYVEAQASNSVKTYLSQNAVTDSDAFQSKFDPVFRDETIEIVTTQREQKYTPYAITGKTIVMGGDNKPYWPPEYEIDYEGERVELHWEANDGNQYDWTLIPLLPFDDSTDESCFNKLLVFEQPRHGSTYSEGVDTAAGLGLPKEERSCCTVLRNQYGAKRDVQAASFTSIDINSAQMARVAAAIAVFYSTDGSGTITSANPLGMRFIVEQVRKAGDECALQLQLMGFYDHHYMHFYDDKDSTTKVDKGKKIGWRTSTWSRDILLDKFVNYVTGGWFKPNDPILIRQLKTFVRRMKQGRATMMHDAGEFDDNVFANAMALITAHDIENESERIQSKYQAPEDPLKVNDGWVTGEVYVE